MNMLSKLDDEMRTLGRKIESLNCLADDVIAKLQDAEFRTGKKRKREVQNWLDNVQEKKNDFQSLERDVQGSSFFQKLPLGKRVEKMSVEVQELVEQRKFFEELLLDVHDSKAMPFLTTKLIGQKFKQNLESVWNCLTKDEVMHIGIYGMGGSGKTTLATHIYNLLSQSSETSNVCVYWLTVSQDFSVDKLQSDIAKVLKLDLTEENERKKRAARISQALSRKKKSVLILDDVWKHFSLEEIGIPCEMNGLKLILTTRLLEVCRKMGCQEIIQVQPLSEDESWNLFLEKLVPKGGEIPWQKDPEIKETAMSMAKRCSRLPLAIITVSRSMMGVNDIHEWRNALGELEECITKQGDMEDDVFSKLKFSYTRVKNEKLKECFLYCALYGEDTMIKRDELITKFIVEGLINRMKTRQKQFDKGHTMLNELENACLLESCKDDDDGCPCVKMHDLMREMALEIASGRLMVKVGVEIPEEQEWTEDLKRISLMKTWIKEIPPGMSSRCPKLSTLILQDNLFFKRIPNSFFEQMSALAVLDLSYNRGIVELPSIISDLENLTALFLRGCKGLRFVPPLGKLRALQLLDLSYTSIKEVPQGMEMLVNLKCLYMDGITSDVKLFPSGILPKLCSLQDVRTGSIKIGGEELKSLRQLEEFSGSLFDFNGYVKSNHHSQLNTCRLHVGDQYIEEDEEYKYEKEVVFRKCCLKNEGEDTVLLLPHNIKRLIIDECHDVSSICDDICQYSLINAKDLKECKLMKCDGIECIVSLSSSSWNQVAPPLEGLERLKLYQLPKLSGLIKWVGVAATPPGTLSNLKELDIYECHEMKKLLTPRLLGNLPNLETISVQFCEEMEEIIGDDEDELMGASDNHPSSSTSTIFTLPKLRKLNLSCLVGLESICKGLMVCDSLEVIEIEYCRKLKRIPLSLPLVNGQPSPPAALERIYITEWRELEEDEGPESLEWDHPNVKDVLQPFLVYT